jgi:formylglycine-generating enzyme required for sulfatase activity
MVILVASDQFKIRRGLADRLREATGHKVLTAASIAEMESVPMAEGALDMLLFSPVFSLAGKETRVRLRGQFPHVQTVALDDAMPFEELVGHVIGMLPAPAPEAAAAAPGEEGAEMLGDYELKALLRSTNSTLIYKAVQRSVQREVALERLRPELAANEDASRTFRRMVRARALVSHHAIAAVYEAQEVDDVIFYTRELVRGQSLGELAEGGHRFSQEVLLQLLQTAGEAFSWMEEHGIPHDPVKPAHLYLGANGTSRIANIAQPEPGGGAGTPSSIRELAEVCQRLAGPRSAQSRELYHVLGQMKADGPHAVQTWKQLAREARSGLQRLVEAHSSLLPESRDRMLARRRMRVKQGVVLLLLLGVLGGVAAGVAWWRQSNRAKVRDIAETIRIPAGPFLFRDGQTLTLPEFDIDRYEVTIAEYSAFLDSLPHGDKNRFDHPDQPPSKTNHLPRDWAEVSAAARAAGIWKGHPITLNAPVFNIDWWDAWAYAKSKNRRLPTEAEWEKAARGADGNLWPWGRDPDPKRANTGADYSDQPDKGGHIDGHAWWNDVDAMPGDVSIYGIHGLAGNVAEWTDTLVPDPDLPDVQVPVFRGGDFHQTLPVPLNAGPWLAKSAFYSQPFLGFRTASSRSAP